MKAKSLYQNKDWIRLSKAFRQANPLCKKCLEEGRFVRSQEVDHIAGFKNRAEFFAESGAGVQALCTRHHSIKTMTEDWKIRAIEKAIKPKEFDI